MRRIHNLIDHTLMLIQPKERKPKYELRFGDENVARISFPKALSTRAEIETAEGTWSLSREGSFKRKILIVRQGESDQAALCSSIGWTSATEVVFPSGKKYLIKPNVWKTLTEIRRETGETIATMKTEGLFRKITRITMNRTAAVVPELPLLIIIGIYAEILNRRDSHGSLN